MPPDDAALPRLEAPEDVPFPVLLNRAPPVPPLAVRDGKARGVLPPPPTLVLLGDAGYSNMKQQQHKHQTSIKSKFKIQSNLPL